MVLVKFKTSLQLNKVFSYVFKDKVGLSESVMTGTKGPLDEAAS
jgi:hypothetical protein